MELKKTTGSLSRTKEIAGVVGEIAGGICGFFAGLTSEGREFGKKGASWLGKKFNDKKNKKKRENIAKGLSCIEEKTSNLRTILIKVADNVFLSFECQFTRVNNDAEWEEGISMLAKDAVYRTINYSVQQHKEENVNSKNVENILFQGVLFGKSKKNPIFEVRYESDKYKTSDLYEKTVGVVLTENVPYVYFVRKGKEINRFGHRRLVPIENWSEIKDQHEPLEEDITQEYNFELNEITEERVKRFVKEIKVDANNLTVKEVEEMVKDAKNQILTEFEKYAENNEKNAEVSQSLLLEIRNIVKNIDGNEFLQKYLKNIITASNNKTRKPTVWMSTIYFLSVMAALFVIGFILKEILELIKKNEASPGRTQDLNEYNNVENPVNLFTGREEKLIELHREIQRPTPQNISKTVIIGLGGIGKSQLAKRYVQKYVKNHYSYIIWINSESYAEIVKSFTSLANDLKINLTDDSKEEKPMETVLREIYNFLTQKDTFLVFDDVENIEILKKYLRFPSSTKSLHILITSRYQYEWGPNIAKVQLNELSLEDGIELVKKGLKLANDAASEDIEILLKTLQYFPLCVVQAVAYIYYQNDKNNYTIMDYVNEFKNNPKDLLNAFESVDDENYKKTTYTTWNVTMTKIASDELYGATALDILNLMSFLATENIVEDMFLPFVESETHLKKATDLLISYSMISKGEKKKVLNVHKLVQDVTRENITKNLTEEIIARTYQSLIEFLFRTDEIEKLNSLKRSEHYYYLGSHFESLYEHVNNILRKWLLHPKNKTLEILETASGFAAVHAATEYRNHRASEILQETFIKLENFYGSHHPNVELKLTLLGQAYKESGEVKKQREVLEKVIAIKKMRYGQNSWRLRKYYQDLGEAYLGNFFDQDEIDLGKAKNSLEKALSIQEKFWGPDRFTSMGSEIINLCERYLHLCKLEIEKGISIRKKHDPPNDCESVIILKNLGAAYLVYGAAGEAKKVLEKSLKIQEMRYDLNNSTNHYQLATIMHFLGRAYIALGEIEKGKELLVKSLRHHQHQCQCDTNKFETYFEIAITKLHLGIAYLKSDEIKIGKMWLKESLTLQEMNYVNNPYAVVEESRYIGLKTKRDEDEKIEERKMLEITAFKCAFRDLNASRYLALRDLYATTLANLGVTYLNLDEIKKGKEVLEKYLTFQEMRRCRDADKREISTVMYYLGEAYVLSGEIENGKKLLEKLLTFQEMHHDTDKYEKAMYWPGVVHVKLDQMEEGKKSFEKALFIQEMRRSTNYDFLLDVDYKKLGEVEKQKQLSEKIDSILICYNYILDFNILSLLLICMFFFSICFGIVRKLYLKLHSID